MQYCELSDLEIEFSHEELARLTGDSSGNSVDFARILIATERASAIIDTYLSRRFTFELSSVNNKLLKHICIALAVNDLYEMKYKFSAIPESILSRKRTAYNMLKMLKSGEISLNSSVHGESASPYLFTNKHQTDKIFNTSILNQFLGDSND